MGEGYRIEVVCRNCPFDGIIELDEDSKLHEKECPSCGSKELEQPEVSFD